MPASPTPVSFVRVYRLALVAVLGFASGLPLALSGPALQTWLTVEGLDLATIGFLSLVGLPYTFKFLWAPLMDRFEPPGLGRRRGWLVATQLALAALLLALAATSPTASTRAFAMLALALAFVAASQDVVIDAYRTEWLPPAERGLGSSLNVAGYRVAMIVSGGLALIWTDAAKGGGMSWPEVYRVMAALMAGAAVVTALLLPRLPAAAAPAEGAAPRGHDLRGFVAVLLAAAAGAWLTDRYGGTVARALVGPWLAAGSLPAALQQRWVDLVALLLGLAVTLPAAAWVARRAGFATLQAGLADYFQRPAAGALLALIVLYKVTDAFALALVTPFLMNGVGYASAELGVVNKVLGLWLSIGGALLGGVWMLRLGLWRALMLFGVLQALTNMGYWWLAQGGRGQLGVVTLPAFDAVIVKLAAATPVDGSLLAVIGLDNLAGGMGTAAFLALLMGLCSKAYTATQFALLSALASVGRVWVGPMAGVLAETIGWPAFFIVATVTAMPALVLLWWLRKPIGALDVDT